MEGEQEDKCVVGDRLEVAVQRMERVGRERRGDWGVRSERVLRHVGKWKHTDPLVVGLVQPLVPPGVVLPAVNPVYAPVGEEQKP